MARVQRDGPDALAYALEQLEMVSIGFLPDLITVLLNSLNSKIA
jgi:hypothetical protein